MFQSVLVDSENLIVAPATATTQNLWPAVAAEGGRPIAVSERMPTRRSDDDLLDALMGQAVPSADPPTTGQAVTIARDGGDVYLNVTQVAPQPSPRRERRRLTLAELNARREWACYYQRAARQGVPFDRAYRAAPIKVIATTRMPSTKRCMASRSRGKAISFSFAKTLY